MAEAIFLRGMIAVAEEGLRRGNTDFRRILAAEPDRERVRLELARAFFASGDYDNAERNFKFARAGDLPPEVKANIDHLLAAITRLKQVVLLVWRWRWPTTPMSMARTTANIRSISTARRSRIADDARQKSGSYFRSMSAASGRR